jgi:hypothetical protein
MGFAQCRLQRPQDVALKKARTNRAFSMSMA